MPAGCGTSSSPFSCCSWCTAGPIPDLRLPGTLMGLRSLIRGGYVGRTDGAEMAAAYTFLRRAEHRLQLQRLRRTHLLPEDSSDMEWLARSDGYTASGTSTAAEVFLAERVRHAGTVRRLHEKLFYRPLLHAVAAVGENEMRLSPEAARARLAALGFLAPDAALRHLAALTLGVSRRAAIQRTLLPVLLDYFSSSPDPDGGLLSYRQVSEALADTPWYLRLLRDEGSVAQRLATLLGGSRLIASLLTRAPEVLRLLVDDAALLGPGTGDRRRGAAGQIPPGDLRPRIGGRRPVGAPAGDAPAGLRRPARPDLG